MRAPRRKVREQTPPYISRANKSQESQKIILSFLIHHPELAKTKQQTPDFAEREDGLNACL
jgi:hypothetical protein